MESEKRELAAAGPTARIKLTVVCCTNESTMVSGLDKITNLAETNSRTKR